MSASDAGATERVLRLERLHARAGFGAAPGAIRGDEDPDAWIAAQLAKARSAPGDAALHERLRRFPSRALELTELDGAMASPGEGRSARAASDGRPAERDPGRAKELKERSREVVAELVGARLVRAVHGEHVLREVMIDFWSNHFSVYARKGPIGLTLPHYQRSVLEAHALGRFGDLLLASAKSPAMLFYLDNWTSVAPQRGKGARTRAGSARPARGINENYARELLELHTLGVGGGYSQADVREVARVFTGWGLESRRRPVFAFRDRLHDPGAKRVLGEPIRGQGIEEGERLLVRLARHPSTAHFVSGKLVARFVADAPPPALVARVARVFLETEGDIPAVLTAVLGSPEFADPAHRKLNTPWRFLVRALRATGGATDGGRPALEIVRRLGEAPFFARTPAGHPEDAASWIDPAAMLERMGVAFVLASGRVRGTSLGPGWPAGITERIAAPTRAERLAVALASPEFQWV